MLVGDIKLSRCPQRNGYILKRLKQDPLDPNSSYKEKLNRQYKIHKKQNFQNYEDSKTLIKKNKIKSSLADLQAY